ncbi:MAG: hypothetical protein V2B13_06095 [Pseudomonadota bacterium]
MVGRLNLSGLLTGLILCLGLSASDPSIPALASNANGLDFSKGAGMIHFVKPGNYFSCDLPSQWGAWIDEREEKRIKVYGVFLTGPKSINGSPVTISVRFFSQANTIFKNEEDYIQRNAFPASDIPPLKGERFGPIQDISLAGRQAKIFERETFDYYPPHSLDTKEIPVKERIVVIPGREDGFYVLFFKAPTLIFAQYAPVFEKVIHSFKPGP